MKTDKLLDPIPPGEILQEDFMKPLALSANQLARDIDVPPGRISEIINGKRSITADTALRLGKYFGVSPEIWLNLQADYDMRVARLPPAAVTGRGGGEGLWSGDPLSQIFEMIFVRITRSLSK